MHSIVYYVKISEVSFSVVILINPFNTELGILLIGKFSFGTTISLSTSLTISLISLPLDIKSFNVFKHLLPKFAF